MPPPRSLKSKIARILAHHNGNILCAAYEVQMTSHRLARLVRDYIWADAAEVERINEAHAWLFDPGPDENVS